MSAPAKSLVEILEGFNRKERNLLVRDILGYSEEKLPLGDDFLKRLNDASGLTIRTDAWWATDYHFDWLFAAAKMLRENVEPGQVQADGSEPMTWTQEDADLVVADDRHLILIEAKAYGAYSNEQVARKRQRFDRLVGEFAGSGTEARFLLMSPRKPERLNHSEGAEPLRWLQLKFNPKLTVHRVERCDTNGKRSEAGGHWQVVKLPAQKATDSGECS